MQSVDWRTVRAKCSKLEQFLNVKRHFVYEPG